MDFMLNPFDLVGRKRYVCPRCGSEKVKKLSMVEISPLLASISAPFIFSGKCLCEECGFKFSPEVTISSEE